MVFGNRKGDPFRKSKLLTSVLQAAAEAAGLGRVTWHQFRHIHSSLLNDLNVPVKIALGQLGQARIAKAQSVRSRRFLIYLHKGELADYHVKLRRIVEAFARTM